MIQGANFPILSGPSTPSASGTTKKPGMLSSLYDSAVEQQGSDYDKIMQSYDSLLADSNKPVNRITSNPLSRVASRPYDGGNSESLNGLQQFGRDGGYSEEDKSALRERGISPVRAIYANQMRNLARQKVLSGGYAPNAGAVHSKMARESAGIIGDQVNKTNAGIAESSARNRLSALNAAAPIEQRNSEFAYNADGETVRQNVDIDKFNSNQELQIAGINEAMENARKNNILNANQGMTSTYGTTPAMVNTFAQHALQDGQQNISAMQIANSIKNQRAGIGLNLAKTVQSNSTPESAPTPQSGPRKSMTGVPGAIFKYASDVAGQAGRSR